MASNVVTVRVEARDFERVLDDAVARIQRLQRLQEPATMSTREAVTGAALALCASPRKFTRRHIFGLMGVSDGSDPSA